MQRWGTVLPLFHILRLPPPPRTGHSTSMEAPLESYYYYNLV